MNGIARVAAAAAKRMRHIVSSAVTSRRWSRLGWGQGRAVRLQAASQLEGFGRVFAESSARTEQDFLQLGRTLRQLYTSATQLAGVISRNADSLRSALAQSRIAGSDGLAAGALKELDSELGATSALLERLREVIRLLHRLHVQVHGIERVSIFLKSSVFSFAIESARTPECQLAFGAFVEELRGLTMRVGRIGAEILREIQASEATQLNGLGLMSSSLHEMRALAQNLQVSAQAAAAEAQRLLDASCATLQESEERTRQLARHADEAVYHLQFGDIIRQKLEHVTSAVQDAAARLRKGTNAEFGATAAAVDRLLAIQMRQLEMIRQEVLTAHSKLTHSFTSITEESGRLAQSMEQWQQEPDNRKGLADPIDLLLKDSARMQELGDQGHALQAEAQGTARKAVESSQQLARHLDQVKVINGDMHIEALNAIVKTAALGDKGATLEVLSMQVDWLYRESNHAVTEILSTLNTLLDEARKTAPEGEAIGTEGGAATRAEHSLADGLDRIGQTYRTFCQAALEAARQVGEQQAALATTQQSFGFLISLAERMEGQVRDLESLRQLLAPWKAADQALPSTMDAALDEMYTMQSERDIHLQANGGGAAAPAAPATPVPAAEQAAPGTLDNMDFFDAPAPEQTPAAAIAAPPSLPAAGEGDNMEFFDAPVLPDGASEAKANEPTADKERDQVLNQASAAQTSKSSSDENIEFF